MNAGSDTRYIKLALNFAKHRDLSKAKAYARRALLINPENDQSRKLLSLCLYELGELDGAAEAELKGFAGLPPEALSQNTCANDALGRARELVDQKKWRKAEALLCGIKHQSVRVLVMRGCIKASVKQYKPAVALFARALEKDNGNRAALAYLLEAASRM